LVFLRVESSSVAATCEYASTAGHIRSGTATISAGLVDLSQSGVRFVQPEPPAALAPGVTLDGPFLFEAAAHA
jgi:uncharacterized protein (DUF2126 family)